MMFTSPTHTGRPAIGAYRQIGASTAVEGASPHKLVALLFEGLLAEIVRARGALDRKDVAAKGQAIGRAVRILEEGLIAPLDIEAGGALAANLKDLYEYVVVQLTHANLHNDAAALRRCHDLLTPIQDAWMQIQPDPSQKAAA